MTDTTNPAGEAPKCPYAHHPEKLCNKCGQVGEAAAAPSVEPPLAELYLSEHTVGRTAGKTVVAELATGRIVGVLAATPPMQPVAAGEGAPVATVTIGDTALGNGMRFTALTDAGRALPPGKYDLFTHPTPAAGAGVPPIPEAYVLLPRNPTLEMMAALSGESDPSLLAGFRADYRAMIAAAQDSTFTSKADKQRAARLLREAVKAGRLLRPDVCSRCGLIPKPRRDGVAGIQGHHHDYRKPLEVEWLCAKCHRAETPLPPQLYNPARGENNGQARLTEESVIKARELRAQGWFYRQIAEHLGVTKRAAMRAVKGEQWAHVKEGLPALPEEAGAR